MSTMTSSLPLGTYRADGQRTEDVSITASSAQLPADADSAVEQLYATHWTQLVRLATLLTRDASVAEEIVQDSFVALHRQWPSLKERAAGPAYLRTSVVNRSRSAIRHRAVVQRHLQLTVDITEDPADRAVQAATDAAVLEAVRGLPRRQQEVLILRYFADLSEREIAETLGLSPGAVKSHAHRGIGALRKLLGGLR